MRGGFLSSFSVPGAGMLASVDEYSEGAQDWNPAVRVAVTPLQVSPACACWSNVNPLRSTGVVLLIAYGTDPATRPESYRQFPPAHGPRLPIWYCRCVV